jgi:hypothetical protein
MTYVLNVRVCSASHNSNLLGWDNLQVIRVHVDQVHFSISVWTGIVGAIVISPYLLSDSLTAQRYCHYQETVLPGLLEDVPLAVRQRLWFQHDWAPEYYGEDVRQWLRWHMVDWMSEAGCMACTVTRSTSDGLFHVGPCEEYIDPPRTNEELAERLKATATTVDENTLTHSRKCHVAHCCLPRNGWRLFQTLTVTMKHPWFDHFTACTIWQ